jgi:peptide/nickel transport system ATP-binding protein
VSELRFEDVTVRFGRTTAVDRVSLTVPVGTVVGLVGESGSGKSTLARAAVGLTEPESGASTLGGRPVPHRGARRPLQMVFQDPYSSLDPRMTIGDSIAEALPRDLDDVRGRRGRRDEVARLLELVHLDPHRARDLPARLSGGQRQRVALARALAGRPEVVIADEITSALDVSIQGAVLNLVRELQAELGLSMLFISHNLAVVRYVASRVAVMQGGRLVEEGPTAQVLGAPEHDYTRELLAAAPGRKPSRATSPTRPALYAACASTTWATWRCRPSRPSPRTARASRTPCGRSTWPATATSTSCGGSGPTAARPGG